MRNHEKKYWCNQQCISFNYASNKTSLYTLPPSPSLPLLMLSCLTLQIDRLSYAVFNIVASCNNNTILNSNQTCACIRVSGEKMY